MLVDVQIRMVCRESQQDKSKKRWTSDILIPLTEGELLNITCQRQ